MRTFGAILREAITAKHLTLKEVAKSTGTQKGYISGICNRKISPPSAKLIRKLCAKLDLDVDDMLSRSVLEKMPKGLSYSAIQKVITEALLDSEVSPVAKGRPA